MIKLPDRQVFDHLGGRATPAAANRHGAPEVGRVTWVFGASALMRRSGSGYACSRRRGTMRALVALCFVGCLVAAGCRAGSAPSASERISGPAGGASTSATPPVGP